MAINASDSRLRRAILAHLIADPLLSTGHLNVTVKDGVVALCGYITSYAQKDAARGAAQRVRGVTSVINHIQVALPEPASWHATASGVARA